MEFRGYMGPKRDNPRLYRGFGFVLTPKALWWPSKVTYTSPHMLRHKPEEHMA